ncbi:MAG: sulfurtransferase-like selenium metabolism protein YedF [Candidatus Adiutrix sp.]|nr:sulfurtransferase-like selenium metabolism protein YedF [Candidatus Adiutrix sp.]
MTILNMTGKPCPIPVIEAKKALRGKTAGESLSVLVDNDISRQNLQKMAEGLGHGFAYESRADGNFLATISLGTGSRLMEQEEAGGLVVAVGRDRMGAGSDELGRTLMKSFIYSLTELDLAPEQILFYNSGVLLSTEGSGVLDDLASLSEKGVIISSCGACLNYFGLTEKLKVGNVTNMYAILSGMAEARKLINL